MTFWVGLVPASLLLRPIWRAASPLRLLHRLLTPSPGGADRLPALGLWPAAASLVVFVWLELVYPGRAGPSMVAVVLVGYAVVQVGLALRFGDDWFTYGDGFETYSTLVARLSTWGRRPDGRPVMRNPLADATATPWRTTSAC